MTAATVENVTASIQPLVSRVVELKQAIEPAHLAGHISLVVKAEFWSTEYQPRWEKAHPWAWTGYCALDDDRPLAVREAVKAANDYAKFSSAVRIVAVIQNVRYNEHGAVEGYSEAPVVIFESSKN